MIMKRVLLQEMTGTVINVYIPEVYKGNILIDSDNVDVIAVEIETREGIIKLIKPRDSKYSSLLEGNAVNIKKYSLEYDYETYLTEIKRNIDNYYSSHKEDYKNLLYKNYFCSLEEFREHPRKIIDYEISFNDEDSTNELERKFQKVIMGGKEVNIPILPEIEETDEKVWGRSE